MHIAHISPPLNAESRRTQSCCDHSRNVAELARRSLAPLELGATGYLAGLLHDCGKFTEEFDDYIRRAADNEAVQRGSVIHSFAGAHDLLKQFHSRGDQLIPGDFAAEVLACSIASHHGLIDLWDRRRQSGFRHRLEHQPDYDARAIASFHEECASHDEITQLFRRAEQEILRFHQQRLFRSARDDHEGAYVQGLLVRLITSAVVDADRTDTRCFMQGIPLPSPFSPDWTNCAAVVDAHVSGFPQDSPIRQARRAFSDHCVAVADKESGLFRLDLPTGGGKTLAALRFAVHHAKLNGLRRIIYAAPLLSIVEQNADAIREAVGQSIPVLEHHSNLLTDAASETITQADLLQETWDAPLIVTTFVQLLNTLFSGKMSSVRRFRALCESVIVIDEVQALPRRMLSLFNCAINFLVRCCRATVVLCSATQPAFHKAARRMLPAEPLLDKALLDRYAPLFRRTSITDAGSCDLPALAALAVDTLREQTSLLIVCNTKREAADLFRALEEISDARLFHLSAGMCMAHRKQVLREVMTALERKERLICVSTQLIEAGVDVSFGSVIRLAAGLDSIVQAAGRCNRHGESPLPGPVRICRLTGERLGTLREISDAQTALTALLEEFRLRPDRYRHDLTSDNAVEDYYTLLYQDASRSLQDYPAGDLRLFDLLSTNIAFRPDGPSGYLLNQAFRTAGELFEVFDSANEDVLVPWKGGAALIDSLDEGRARHDLAYAAGFLQEAKPYTVSVPVHQLERMKALGTVCTLLDGRLNVLNPGSYESRTGIKEGNDPCSTLIL